ncbi:MAG: exo-alpha-sialidase [Gammaproteobacteria bacterium]|nr:exo-alpha-sialidase [Gammaproteobacteria bacterium]
MPVINKALLSFGSLLLLTLTWQIFSQSPPGQFYQAPLSEAVPVETSIAHHQATFASHESTPEVHSATAIELANNDIMAFWYGGTREGHKDVMIYQNTWVNKTKQWGQEKGLISRVLTKKNTSRYIRKLGNPVVTRGADNSIWLFYVSVSVGGWAGSSINLTRSYDEGKTWSTSQRLITSPFLNLSTLIKGTPIHYTDGSIGLPVYHELIGKFGELLILNSNGEVTNKIRLSWGKTSLQPILFTTSANDAVAMMRYQGEAPNRILTQTSNNAGLSWTPVKKSLLPNPGAGIIGLKLKETGKLLLAFNNDEEEREDMSLAMSSNQGKTWQLSRVVEENHLEAPDKDQQFAYPWLLQTENGTIHLLYTWHKSHIKHITFNEAWLNSGSTTGRGTNHEP